MIQNIKITRFETKYKKATMYKKQAASLQTAIKLTVFICTVQQVDSA